MNDLICPLNAPLVKGDFGCEYAKEIVRRGGAEIACKNSGLHTDCCMLHGLIRSAYLKSTDQQDDLLTLPHSVLVKIQYGGLLGLQKLVNESEQVETVENISALVLSAKEKFTTLERVPLDSINKAIGEFKAQRRHKK